MVKRSDRYKLNPGDDIGDPTTLNTVFEDLDTRMHAQELKGQAIDESASNLERVALSRLDDVFTGILQDAQQKLRDTGAWFKAESASEFIPATGDKRFILTEATRGGYISTRDILIVSASDDSHVMSGQLINYTPIDGALDISVLNAFGDTSKSDWLIFPMAASDGSHIAQRNNPHGTTADQVGAYTKAETQDLLSQHTNQSTNPHNVTKAQLGLGNVNNTSDTAKPISSATQTALETKPDIITGATVPEAKTTAIIMMDDTGKSYRWVEDLGLPNGGSYIALHDSTKLSVIAAGDPLPTIYSGEAVLWLATDKIYKWDTITSTYNVVRKNIVQTQNSTPILYAASTNRHIGEMDTSITTTVEDVRIRVVFSVDYESHGNFAFYVKRSDGTTTKKISAPNAGSRPVGIATATYDSSDSTTGDRLHIEFLDTVSTVGTYTYQLWARGEASPLAINRTLNDTNVTYAERGMSFAILEENV